MKNILHLVLCTWRTSCIWCYAHEERIHTTPTVLPGRLICFWPFFHSSETHMHHWWEEPKVECTFSGVKLKVMTYDLSSQSLCVSGFTWIYFFACISQRICRHVLDQWAGSVLHFTRTWEKCSLCACLRELIFFMGAFSSVFQKYLKRSVYDGVGSIPWDKLVSLFLLFQHQENTVKVPDFRFRIFALLLSEVYGAGVFSLSPQKSRAAGSSHGSCELVLRFWHFHLPEYPVYPPAASLCDSQIHYSRIWLSCEPSNIWTSDWWEPNLCSWELLANGETQGCSFPNRIFQWPG